MPPCSWLTIGALAFALLPASAPGAVGAIPASELEIAAVGDITLGRAGQYPPGGSKQLLGRIARDLRAPVSLGNLETALVDPSVAARLPAKCNAKSPDCFLFGAPTTYARGLRDVGFTILNLANNHTNDYGEVGQAWTVLALARAGLRSTGRPEQITVLKVRGLRVAVLGFAPYSWASDLRDLKKVRALVSAAARRADLVVVTMHIGAEGSEHAHVPRGAETYLGEPRGNSRAFSHAAVDAGADLVVGHGPHVLRGMEWYRGRLIAHSLGNVSGYRTLNMAGVLAYSAILRVTLDAEGEFVDARLVPLRLVGQGTPTRDPGRRSFALIRQLSKADFGRSAVAVDADGRIAPRAP